MTVPGAPVIEVRGVTKAFGETPVLRGIDLVVPEHGAVTWWNWVQYAWNRRPPNPVGLTPLFFYFKPLETPSPKPFVAPPAVVDDKAGHS